MKVQLSLPEREGDRSWMTAHPYSTLSKTSFGVELSFRRKVGEAWPTNQPNKEGQPFGRGWGGKGAPSGGWPQKAFAESSNGPTHRGMFDVPGSDSPAQFHLSAAKGNCEIGAYAILDSPKTGGSGCVLFA